MNIKNYTGTWRSYKAFFSRGNVKHHEINCYREVTMSREGDLVLESFSSFTSKMVLQKDAWQILTDNKRHYLYIEGRKLLEIITLEQNDLVLQELLSGEKIFLASLSIWHERLLPKKEIDQNVYIALWSKSLIKLVTIEQ